MRINNQNSAFTQNPTPRSNIAYISFYGCDVYDANVFVADPDVDMDSLPTIEASIGET